jgi:hypothetical protein
MAGDARLAEEALTRLAADARSQEQYLRELGTWPSLDELALGLDDVEGASELLEEAIERVELLSEKLDAMRGPANARLWEPDALSGSEWEEVRRLAADALAAQGSFLNTAQPSCPSPGTIGGWRRKTLTRVFILDVFDAGKFAGREDFAFSVYFEETGEQEWFAPRLVKKIDP